MCHVINLSGCYSSMAFSLPPFFWQRGELWVVSAICRTLKTLVKLCWVASVCLLECNRRQSLAAGVWFSFISLPSLFASLLLLFHSLRGWGTLIEEANIGNVSACPTLKWQTLLWNFVVTTELKLIWKATIFIWLLKLWGFRKTCVAHGNGSGYVYWEREKWSKKSYWKGNLKLKNGIPETLLKIKAITHNPMKEHRGNQVVTNSHDERNLQHK